MECPSAATLVDRGQLLSDIVRRAKRGSAIDQYRLGLRYESGVGVAQDLRRAKRHYEIAARDSYQRNYRYSPPVGSANFGRVEQVGAEIHSRGIDAARQRLTCLASPKSDGEHGQTLSQTLWIVEAFLSFSAATPNLPGLRKVLGPPPDLIASNLADLARPQLITVGALKGMFSYQPISCFEGTRRVRLILPYKLCDTASEVHRYRFYITKPDGLCLKPDSVERYLIASKWLKMDSAVPASTETMTMVPPIAAYRSQDGRIIQVSPVLRDSCVKEFSLFKLAA